MAGESPAAVLVDGVNGVELAVVRGAPIPALTRVLLFAGEDGAGDVQVVLINPDGSITTTIVGPSTSSVTSVPQSIVSATLLAANPARKGASICNNITGGLLYVKIGAGASPTDFSVKLLPGGVFALPFPAYTGLISGVWSVAGGGSAQVTETV